MYEYVVFMKNELSKILLEIKRYKIETIALQETHLWQVKEYKKKTRTICLNVEAQRDSLGQVL